jgi:hypothetical protein
MLMRTIKRTSAAIFAASAIVTAAASSGEAAVASTAAAHTPASVQTPSGYRWVQMGGYLSKQVCLDHGYQYIQMGLATSYYCSGPFPACPAPIYELWIYTSQAPAITIPKDGHHQRATGATAPC